MKRKRLSGFSDSSELTKKQIMLQAQQTDTDPSCVGRKHR